jgi:hypothetical protein
MNRSRLLKIAAGLVLVTCVGHLVGTFMPVPPEQIAVHAAIATMKATQIPMPVGASRSYMQILDGNNLCTSLLLLLCAVQLFVVSSSQKSEQGNQTVFVIALSLAGFALISVIYFFPIPALLAAAASGLSFWGLQCA